MARPTKYRDSFPIIARAMCRIGAKDEDLAKAFEVKVRTIYRWEKKYPEFCQALKEGKAKVDAEVEDSLLKRAMGYEYEETKIIGRKGKNGDTIERVEKTRKQVAPDVLAAIFWLKNRRPDLWRDVQRREVSGPDGGPLKIGGEITIYQLPDNKRGNGGPSSTPN